MNLSTEQKETLIKNFPDEYNQLVELGQKIGPNALDQVLEVFAGQKPHIPTMENFYKNLLRELRNIQMRNSYDPGKNKDYKQIAIDFSGFEGVLGELSERQAREIIDGDKKTYQRPPETMKPIKIQPETHKMILELAEKHDIQMHKVLQEAWELLIEKMKDDLFLRLNKKYGVQLQIVVGE